MATSWATWRTITACFRWHGQTENNHPGHPNHRHAINSDDSPSVDVNTDDADDTAYRWAQRTHVWTSGIDNLSGETAEITGPYGRFKNNQDNDNRPPYRVVIIIERWK